MSFLPRDDGEGFIELALVLILVAIVLIVILALLEPEITAFVERIQEMFVSATS
ncbi:MAG: Flp family type IVb pilin [Anaerolineae bacterium]|nr:Flp family type IVb pilin [Anaerolineae bacterium]MCO5189103.1 Flp family type IVb pilin [Anaerolineae bacterium]MCO5193240.1 Flp family type IVb pilin [Anaerolineae bacterium]MCO5198185.1 Flp family type IVb pilin [Anaerolineae bacterium]MCO5205491.1 Flp family type IVb pilin [Anaerolineae bacterium]